jgi:hypothetical protein
LGPAEQKVKLEELAQYVHDLIVIFEKDELGEPYQLLTRLFSDQCECASEEPSKVQVKKKTEGATLQSPYDPDASCIKDRAMSLHRISNSLPPSTAAGWLTMSWAEIAFTLTQTVL